MSDVKRYKINAEGFREKDDKGRYVLYDDYEADTSDLLARIAELEREKEEAMWGLCLRHGKQVFTCPECIEEEARDKALEDVRTKIEYEIQYDTPIFKVLAIRDIFRAMKGTKP